MRRVEPRPFLLAFALLVLFACGKKEGNAPPVSTIVFWQFWPMETIQPLIASFEKQNPGMRVEVQQLTWQSGLEKITAAVAAGEPPDLCELGSTWFGKFAANGALADLSASVADLEPHYRMWEACTYEGKVQALPWLVGTRAMFYNKTLVREAGRDPERLPQTWEELGSLVGAIHNPERGVYGYGLNAGERYVQYKKFMPFAWGLGGDVLGPQGCTFSEAPVLEALRYYLSLKEYALVEKQEILDQAFQEGRLGAMISGAWMLRKLPKEAPTLEYGVALVPRPSTEGGTHASFGGGEVLVTFARSRNRDAALRLARHLIEAPQAMAVARVEQSVLPAAKGAEQDPFFAENPHQAVFLQQLETAVYTPTVESWVEIEDVVDAWLEKAVFGRASPEEALEGACREIVAVLERSGS